MAQVCGTCDRSWDDRAAFCGSCGARLAGPPPTRPTGDRHEGDEAATRRWRWVVLGAVLVVGTALAVPAIDLDGTPPVTGDVGVPDRDTLQSAVAAGTGQPPADTDTAGASPTPVPPPNVSCFRGTSRIEFPCVLWIRRVHDTATTGQEMTVAGGARVVAIGPGSLRGYDAATGRQVWTQPLDRPVDTAQVGDEVGVLHYGGRAEVFALDDGRWLWGVDAFTPLYGQTVADSRVLTGDRDADGPKLAVYGARDGALRWEARTGGATIFSVLASSDRGALVLTHDNRTIFLDRATGEPAWALPEGAQVLDVAEGTALVATFPGDRDGGSDETLLQAVDLRTGTVRWRHAAGARDAPPVVQGNRVLVPADDRLTALDVSSGAVAWTVRTPGPEVPVSGPGVHGAGADASVVLTSSRTGVLHGRDRASGKVRWRHDQPTGPGTVMHRDGLVLLRTADGMEAIDVTTGQQLIRVHADGPLRAIGMDPELAMDHRSGYAVGFDFPERGVLVGDT